MEEVISLGEGYFQIDGTATIREINKATKWQLPPRWSQDNEWLGSRTTRKHTRWQPKFEAGGNYRFETKEINDTGVKTVVAISLQQPHEQPTPD